MGHYYFFSVIAHRHSLFIALLIFMCLVRGGSLLQLSEVASEEAGFKGNKGTAVVEGSKIGSRPPRCVGICRECGRCEAVQVPAIPQQRNAAGRKYSAAATVNSRGDYSSNYKPLSWKCKCGDVIVNP